MTRDPKQSNRLGVRALQFVHGGTESLIVRELQAGARTVDELSQALPTISREVLNEHLKRLTREGWLNAKADTPTGTSPSAYGTHRETMPQLPPGAGSRVFAILSDEPTRRILLRVGQAPGDVRQLQADLDTSEATVRTTLAKLLYQQFITQQGTGSPNRNFDAPFELTRSGRGLAVIAFMLARIEWAALKADGAPPQHSLREYLQLLTPEAVVPRALNGQCRLVERYPAAPSQTVSLRIEYASITVQAGAGAARPDVQVSGLPLAWDGALLHANTRELLLTGNRALFDVVLRALADAR